MEWWVIVFVTLGCLWLSKFLLFTNNNKKSSDDGGRVAIKGSSGWPFIGETLHFIASGYSCRPVSFMDKRKSLYGDVFKTHLLGKPVIVSTDRDVNKFILVNNANLFVPCYPKSIIDLLGDSSILSMDGPLHRRLHGSIARFFKSSELKDVLATYIQAAVKASLANWTSDPPRTIYVQDQTSQVTFEILVRLLMNIGPGKDLDFIKTQYKEFIKGLVCVPVNFPGTQLYKSLKAKKKLLAVTRKTVEERKAWMQMQSEDQSKVAPKDAIEMLLREAGYGGDQIVADSQRLPLDLICSNIVEMMIPGDESVPMIMTLAVKYLTDYPLVLNQLVEENMELKRQKMGSPTSCYHWTDYMALPFTQHVISETLRMANIVNAVWRKATTDVEIKGYLIPKGTTVMASFTSVHMDEQNYENPYVFDPWRWQKKGPLSNCSHAFTPFGGGQRLCPGAELARLEISIFLHHLVTTYSWVAKEDEIVYFPTVKMKRKLPITVAALN